MPPKKSSAAKKKKNLGSARGFATVSVPKRVDPVVDETAVDGGGGDNDSAAASGGAEGTSSGAGGADGAGNRAAAAAAGDGPHGTGASATGAAADGKSGDWDDSPEALERKELQELAERIKPGCDKEISRVVKVRLFRLCSGLHRSLGERQRGPLADPRAFITVDRFMSTSAACPRLFPLSLGTNATW